MADLQKIVEKAKPWALLLAGLFVASRISKMFGSGNADVQELTDAINPQNLSYPIEYYTLMADTIETAIYGAVVIEYDQTVADVLFEVKNNDDWLQLIVAYDKRPRWFINLFVPQNLVATLREYLDQPLIEEVNRYFERKNISYRI